MGILDIQEILDFELLSLNLFEVLSKRRISAEQNMKNDCLHSWIFKKRSSHTKFDDVKIILIIFSESLIFDFQAQW